METSRGWTISSSQRWTVTMIMVQCCRNDNDDDGRYHGRMEGEEYVVVWWRRGHDGLSLTTSLVVVLFGAFDACHDPRSGVEDIVTADADDR